MKRRGERTSPATGALQWQRFRRRWLALALLLGTSSAAGAVANLVQLADGLYLRQGRPGIVFQQASVANLGVVIGETCVAVIDTGGSPAEGEALRAAVEKLTDKPICYVVLTHGHPDHFLGNSAFADIPGVKIIAHDNFADEVNPAKTTWLARLETQKGAAAADKAWLLPDTKVSEVMRLQLGSRELRLKAFGPAHSYSDLQVFDSHTQTLWLSDLLFHQHVPVLAGSLRGWLSLLESLSTVEAKRVIPGHGLPSKTWPSPALARQRQYLMQLEAQTKQLIDEGISLFEAQQSATAQNDTNWPLYQQYHPRNVARAWGELEWAD